MQPEHEPEHEPEPAALSRVRRQSSQATPEPEPEGAGEAEPEAAVGEEELLLSGATGGKNDVAFTAVQELQRGGALLGAPLHMSLDRTVPNIRCFGWECELGAVRFGGLTCSRARVHPGGPQRVN